MEAPIGLYKGHVTPIDRLVKTTVGRQEMLEDLLEKLQRNAGKKGGQHYLFIGPRGIGKTHFLSLVENAVEKSGRLSRLYMVIRFPEENNRILSFADILLGIVGSFGEAEANKEWRAAHESLSTMENDQEIIDAAVPRLKHYQKQTGKTLLLLMENLGTLFSEQIKNEQDIHRFRTFLMDSPCATLIGTSPIYFPGITNAQRPFYEFFDIQVLEDLTEELTLELVRKNLELEDRRDLLEDFEKLSPKIRALHSMTGGNPRLTMMLYELIAYESIMDVKLQFQKLLDQITPFYQDRLKDLAPQERALLETIALMRTEPRTPAALAARMRKPQQQISSLLKRMIKAGYLTVSENPEDKRSRLYRIKEGFFDLWLAMSESRGERKRLGYLVNVFEVYYRDRMEREKKRQELWQRVEDDIKEQRKRENDLEFLDYLSELGDGNERFKAKIELSLHRLNEGDALRAKELLVEAKPLASERGIFIWMTEQALRWSEGKPGLDVNQWFDGLMEYWKTQRSGDLEKAVVIAQKLGMDLSGRGLHRIRIELLQDALECASKPEDKIRLYHQIADSASIDGQSVIALQALESALKLCMEIGNRRSEAVTLNNMGRFYYARGDYGKALEYLEKSLAIEREIGDRAGEGTTLNKIGQIFNARGDYGKALEYLEKSLAIQREIGDREGEGGPLNNLATTAYARGDYGKALEYFEKSLAIQREIGDRENEGTTLNNISQIFKARGDYGKALECLEKSLAIQREIGNRAGEGATLNNLGAAAYARGDYGKALEYLETSLAIQREIGDRAGEGVTLNNISQIFKARGDYGKALEYLETSLAIRREIGDRRGEGTTLNNIGSIFSACGDYGKALEYLETSLAIQRKIGDRAGEGTTLSNISHMFKARGDYGKALECLEKSLAIRREIGDSAGMIPTLHNMAHIYVQNQQLQAALDAFGEALKLSIETSNAEGLFNVSRDFGNTLCLIGQTKEGVKLLQQSLEIGKQIGHPDLSQVEALLQQYS